MSCYSSVQQINYLIMAKIESHCIIKSPNKVVFPSSIDAY